MDFKPSRNQWSHTCGIVVPSGEFGGPPADCPNCGQLGSWATTITVKSGQVPAKS